MGFSTVLATHRRFPGAAGLPDACRVWPLFRYSTYGGDSLTNVVLKSGNGRGWTGRFAATATAWTAWVAALDRWRHRRRHRRRLEAFARACDELLRCTPLRPGDQVFLPTVSDFDLLALSEVLPRAAGALEMDWHLQFHFGFLEGRDGDYARQRDRLEAMRHRFERALEPLQGFRLHFYATTRQMAAQYQLLDVADFHWLPYPVNPAFMPRRDASRPAGPLRIVCAGRFRDEKGSARLSDVVEQLWSEQLEPGKAQLIVQGSDRDVRQLVSRHVVEARRDQIERGEWPSAPLVRVAFPLSTRGYLQFLRAADVGLFLYDAERYHSRCSGVLVEMLCVGIPVVVPAGCWLSDEICEPGPLPSESAARGATSLAAVPLPVGHVGRSFTAPEQAALAVREVLDHHAHYASAARAFAENYRPLHLPQRAVEHLLAHARTSRLGGASAAETPGDAERVARA
jgi:glycosyltransferase involved in cell wall biosynthesis